MTDIEVTYTPGPWRIAKMKNDDYSFVVARISDTHQNYTIARPGHPIKEVHEANARLIAAAPELLLALEHLLFACNHGNGAAAWAKAKKDAATAISKATGVILENDED